MNLRLASKSPDLKNDTKRFDVSCNSLPLNLRRERSILYRLQSVLFVSYYFNKKIILVSLRMFIGTEEGAVPDIHFASILFQVSKFLWYPFSQR